MTVITSQIIRLDKEPRPACPFALEMWGNAGRCVGKGCMAWTPVAESWAEKREVWPYAEFKKGQVVVLEAGQNPKYRPKAEVDDEVATLVKEGWVPREEDVVGGVRYLYGHPLVWVRGLIERGRCGRVPTVRV